MLEEEIRYYQILGLEPFASFEEIKHAYRDLVKVWHPDRFAHDPKLQRRAEEKLKEINEAYEHFRFKCTDFDKESSQTEVKSQQKKSPPKADSKKTAYTYETPKRSTKSYENFCPRCAYFEEQTGVCKKFYFNVHDYPKKFVNKCNANYFSEYLVENGFGSDTAIGSKVIGWVGVILIFIVINAVLYFAQEIYHKEDVKKSEVIEEQLTRMDNQIETLKSSYNSRLSVSENQAKQIKELENKLQNRDFYYRSLLAYKVDYQKYESLIEQFNTNIESAKQIATEQDQLIEKYNKLVEEYNQLAESAYSRWYLIPFGGKKRRSFSKH